MCAAWQRLKYTLSIFVKYFIYECSVQPNKQAVCKQAYTCTCAMQLHWCGGLLRLAPSISWRAATMRCNESYVLPVRLKHFYSNHYFLFFVLAIHSDPCSTDLLQLHLQLLNCLLITSGDSFAFLILLLQPVYTYPGPYSGVHAKILPLDLVTTYWQYASLKLEYCFSFSKHAAQLWQLLCE